jgi:FAD/FMN-containing dehydrogenase
MPIGLQTLGGEQATLSDEVLDELRMTFHGPVITPEESPYEDACVVQNGMIHRRPGLVVRCSGTADVVDAIAFARDRDLLVAVRGGGHSIAGHSICDGGLLVDLSGMRGVWVDPLRRVVRVQGGATWGDVDREAQLFGLAVPGGIVSTTGVAGLTLGGGIGWLHRKYGLACDNLRAAEVVTADGQVLRADETEHPDLFWALRGGGGNFGVVTAFEFDAHPVGPTVMNGAAMYAAADADEILPAWRDWAAAVPDEVTTRAVLWSMPEDPHLPPAVRNQDVFIAAAVYAGPVDQGEAALDPVRRFGKPLADLSGPTPYRAVQSLFDPFFPRGELLSYWKSIFLADIGEEAVELILRLSRSRPHPLTMVHLPLLGGAVKRVDAAATAFGDRSADYMLSVDGNWLDPDGTPGAIEWVRDAIAEADRLPHASGTYLNFSGDTDIDPTQRQAAFGENLQRLRRVKAEYDPTNRFRLNNNIPPER